MGATMLAEMIQPQTADITIGIAIITALSLLFLSRFLLQGIDSNQQFQEDDTPTTIASRGTYTNLVMGTKRIGPTFGWAGNRFTKEEVIGSAGGGKGGGGGGGNITQTVYYEDGWHILSVGPASRITSIYENGKNILSNPISKATHPSGTSVETEVGSFLIYWGEIDQPINSSLASSLGGINSAWPYICYVYWSEKRLGTGPTWPVLEYDLTCLTCAENADIVGSFEPIISSNDGGIGYVHGLNPAAITYQILTAPFPHGCGLDPDLLDFTSLESTGLLFQTESLAMNLDCREGNNLATRKLQAMMLDAGFLLYDHPEGRLVHAPIRDPGSPLPIVDQDFQTQPEVEVEVVPFDDVDQVDRVIFTYKEKNFNYRDNTIEFGDDAIAEANGRYRTATIRIETVTDNITARKIANRRAPEAIGDLANIKYDVTRGASLLMPGQVFQDEEGRVVRVLATKRRLDSPSAQLDTAIDVYGLPELSDADDPDVPNPQIPAARDKNFTFIEMPASIGGTDSIAIGVLRVRANASQAGAFVWASIDDEASFFSLGAQNAAAAGFVLTEAISASDGPDIITEGPKATSLGPDTGEVINLAAQTAEWQNGRQVCVIEDTNGDVEAFFLKEIELQAETLWTLATSITQDDYRIPTAENATGLRYKAVAVVGSGLTGAAEPTWPTTVGQQVVDNDVTWEAESFEYQLKDLIRARYQTSARDFAIGDKVWVIESSRVSLLRSSSLLTPGETVCVRTQPFTSSEEVNIDNVTSVCKDLTGAAVAVPGQTFIIGADGALLIGATGDRVVGVDLNP